MAYKRLTEIKRIKVDAECHDNPVYLKWLNTSSGYSQWLFFQNYIQTITTQAAGEYLKNEEDLEAAVGGAEFLGKNVQPSMNIGAMIDIADMDGMKGLIQSPKVQMLINPDTWEDEGPTWQRVKVRVGSYVTYRATETRMTVEMTIDTPEINVQGE